MSYLFHALIQTLEIFTTYLMYSLSRLYPWLSSR